MKYLNTKTGVVIDVTAPISGGYWVDFEAQKTPEPVKEVEVKAEAVEPIEEEPVEDFDLTSMSVAELKQYAKDNDIELTGTKKAEIIKDIALAFEG